MNHIRQEVCVGRAIVLSNGELHVGLNKFGLVHDFYYPYVGLENHAAGNNLRHKVGIFVDGALSWLDEGGWTFEFHYPHTALIGHTKARNESLGVLIEFDDTVDSDINLFMRNIHIINLRDQEREIKLYMYQAFVIGDSRSNTDTAQYLPDSNAILHYRGRRAFIISGKHGEDSFDQYSIGLFDDPEHEGSHRDAEDGFLGGNNIEHGRVDSILGFTLHVAAHSSERVHYWISAGRSTREALLVHKQVNEDGLGARLHATAAWWHKWLEPTIKTSKNLPLEHQDMFIRSVMVLKSQMDKRGAIIASTDTTMLNYSKDAYGYSWPRDGAYTVWPLIRLGYYAEAEQFFEFCRRGLHAAGYLMHKYRADGALGSSWHPYVHEGDVIAPPIQEDETALVVFVFAQLYELSKDEVVLRDFYPTMIRPMADFLAEYIDDVTGLPKPSYDLWEEVFSTTTYTTSVTYAGLLAASDLASAVGDKESAVKWRLAADDIKHAASQHLYNEARQVFYKGVIVKDGKVVKDQTIDTSAVFGAFMFGLFDSDSHEMTSSVETTKQVFGSTHDTPGLPRYENDYYRRTDPSVNGNWWYITTLWLAQYSLEKNDEATALNILNWAKDHASGSGMFGEQINPLDNHVIAPVPLTWSHAEYISTLLDIAGKAKND